MLSFIKGHFWWYQMNQDIKEYVAACSTSAQNKLGNQSPVGLLQPSPTPSRPCSHIALYCITGLFPSEGNTTMVTVVDHFSKSARFSRL